MSFDDEKPDDDAPEQDEATEAAAEAPEKDEATEAATEAADEPASGAPASEPPPEELPPKQRRKLKRSRAPEAPNPPRTPEQRDAERREAIRAKKASRSHYRKGQRAKRGEPGTGTPPAERSPVAPKTRQGVVVSAKADKTISVRIDVVSRHPAYEKVMRRSRKLYAHDEQNAAGEGDMVRIAETRPVSRTKRWRLVDVLEKAR